MKLEEIDSKILSDLIGKCEHSMIGPLKKKKTIAIEMSPDGEDEEESTSEALEGSMMAAVGEPKEDEDDGDLEALMEALKMMKG